MAIGAAPKTICARLEHKVTSTPKAMRIYQIKAIIQHKQRLISRSVLILILLAISGQSVFSTVPTNASSDPQPPSHAEVNHAIELATDYLERACGPDGKFVYQIDIHTGHESSDYDILRHEGAIYALAMANRENSSPRAIEAILRASKFLRQNYIGPGVSSDQLVVWSRPLTESPERQYADLGGTGLGLVALAAARKIDPKIMPLSDLQAMGRFALFLQKDDGSFVHKYYRENGPEMKWESLYYPGEAALGFISLYEADHSLRWLLAAAKALSYLAKNRERLTTVPPDHWALIATASLLPHLNRVQSVVTKEELLRHAIQICSSIVRDQFRGSVVGLDGAFDSFGRTGPTATRLEGLLASRQFLSKGELQEKVDTCITRGIDFLLRTQIQAGPHEGGMPGAIVTRAHDSTQIRVDYVQHALCAWLRYQSSHP